MRERSNDDVVAPTVETPVRETVAANSSQCAACAKKLHALRRRRLCQICSQFVCRQCINTKTRRRRWFLRERIHDKSCQACVPCAQQQRHCQDSSMKRRLEDLELKHFGWRLAQRRLQRHWSCGDVEDVRASPPAVQDPVVECAICVSNVARGDAVFTTACGHHFHWICLKNITNRTSNKCPACSSIIEELQAGKECLHPRLYPENRFCRDCGQPATELTLIKQAVTSGVQESPRSLQPVGLQLLRLLDDEAFECVQLLLKAFRLVVIAVNRIAGIQWLDSFEFLALKCVRGLFYGLIYVVYGFYELTELRPLAPTRSPLQN